MAGKKGVIPGKPFVKGDPRINRNGKPKDFTSLRKLAQRILEEENKHPESGLPMGTTIELLLRGWSMSADPRLQIQLVNIAYGKVPEETNINGTIANVSFSAEEWLKVREERVNQALDAIEGFEDDDFNADQDT